MERLTDKIGNTNCVAGCGSNCKYGFEYCRKENWENCETISDVIDKLAEYEDLEELIGIPPKELAEIFHQHIPNDCKHPQKAIVLTDGDVDKWREYKAFKKDGRLIKLPCKIGDTIYEMHYTNRQYVICSHIVSKFVIMPYRFPRVEIYFENENGFSTSDFEGRVNEDLFLTRDEAEARLKELRGGENG